MQKKFLYMVLMTLLLVPAAGFAKKSKTYIYRSRINWVKLEKLSKKQLAGVELQHPAEFSVPQMQAMLQSLEMNKGSLFGSELKTSEIFTDEEAAKYAPYIVEALAKAAPNQVVNMAIVHKKNKYLVRNAYLSVINVFVTDQGLHFYFGKIFARLDGDYENLAMMDETFRRAKSLRVSLNATEGQKLAFSDANEVILDLSYDFISNKKAEEAFVADEGKASDKKSSESSSQEPSVKQRLEQLEQLKKDGLISDKEYKTKRAEILKEL